MAKEYRLSAERLEELKQELTYLKTVREKEVAELIKEARSFGDLSENSEYDEAKTEQGKLYSRIAELDEILSNYTLIEEQENHMDMVHVGNNVVVKDLEFDETLHYQIVGSQEADPMNGRISEDSPSARPFWARTPGKRWWWRPPPATSAIRLWRSRDNQPRKIKELRNMAEKNRKDNPQEQEQDLSQILQVRREKLAALQKEGKDPFQQTKFTVSAHTQQIKDHFDQMEGQAVSVAGRLMSKRGMGKVSFCDLQDRSGRIQLYARKDEMDEAVYNAFKKSTTSATWWGWKARSSGPSGGR